MGETTTFLSEDKVAIPLAIVLHLAVVAALVFQPVREDVVTPPQPMAVSLASEVSLESTAPDPAAESRAALAPVLAEEPAPFVEPQPAPPEPRMVTPDPTPPQPTRRTTTPTRQPVKPPERASTPARTPPARTPPKEPAKQEPATKKGGGSEFADAFRDGAGSSRNSEKQGTPAATFGSAERAALSSAITRQLRRHWSAPNGVDAEKLVSTVRWRLNKDGSLSGRPSCNTAASSITDLNRPQSGLHCERAIRAVQLASPFNLPEQFYSQWDDLEWQFDRRL